MMAENINIKIHIVNRDRLANILIWSMGVKLKLLVKRKEILLPTCMALECKDLVLEWIMLTLEQSKCC